MLRLFLIILCIGFSTQVLKAQQNLLNTSNRLQQSDSAKISQLMFNTSLTNSNLMSLYQQDSARISQSTTLGKNLTNTNNNSASSLLNQHQTALPVNNSKSNIVTPLGNNTLINTNNDLLLPAQTPLGNNTLLNGNSSGTTSSSYHYLGTGHYLQNGGGN
jgi:hypothetical protein